VKTGMQTIAALGIIAGLALLTACSWMEKQSHTLELNGPLNAEAVEGLRRDGLDNASVLRVSSEYGDEAAALALAEMLEELEVRVEIVGPCVGPCALYVVAAAETIVKRGGLIACGRNVVGARAVPEQAYGAPLNAQHLELASRALQFFDRRGVSRALALNCWLQIMPLCYTTLEFEGRREPAVATAREYWVPRAADLSALGLTVEGVPEDSESAAQHPYLRTRPATEWGGAAAYEEAFARGHIEEFAMPCPGNGRQPRLAVPRYEEERLRRTI
jgi:hypothetical protein